MPTFVHGSGGGRGLVSIAVASPGQRIQQSYVSGAGASGALLAGALIGFIALVGLVSFNSWPQPSVSPVSAVDSSLAPARVTRAAEPNPASPAGAASSAPAPAPVRVRLRTVPPPGPGTRAVKEGRPHSRGRVHLTPAPPTRGGAQTETGSAPGNSGNAPGHTKQTVSRTASETRVQGPGNNGHASGRASGSEDPSHGNSGNGRSHGNSRGRGNDGNGRGPGHAHGGGPNSD
jgi:translation initiation factor IF-2